MFSSVFHYLERTIHNLPPLRFVASSAVEIRSVATVYYFGRKNRPAESQKIWAYVKQQSSHFISFLFLSSDYFNETHLAQLATDKLF